MPEPVDERGVRLTEHGLVRECCTPASAVRELTSSKLADLVDRRHDLGATWLTAARNVAESLTAVVPGVEDRAVRGAVLKIRRTLHRGDVPPARLTDALPAAVRARLDEAGLAAVLDLVPEVRDLDDRLSAAWTEALRTERAALATAASANAVRATAQLSGSGLLGGLDRWAAEVGAGTDPDGTRARKTEATLANLLARAALKPSPFGGLVLTRPVLITRAERETPPATGEPEDPAPTTSSVCRLPRQLVSWAERALCEHPALAGSVLLRRAPVLVGSPASVTFLVRGRDGTDTPAAVERAVRVDVDAVLTALLEVPADVAVSERDVRARCAPLGPPGRVDDLIRLGVLARDLGVGEQADRPAGRLADLVPDTAPAELRSCVRRLAGVEDRFARATPEQRAAVLARIREDVVELARLCAVPAPPVEAARTLVYEDTVVVEPLHEDASRWDRVVPDLRTLHGVVPLFDDHAHTRAVVGEVVRELFGPGPHRLLTLYAALSAPPRRALLQRRLTDLDSAAAHELSAVQDAVFGCTDGDDVNEETVLDRARLRAVVAAAPAAASRWTRVSWAVQWAGRDLVVNGASVGFGKSLSRFLTAHEQVDAEAGRAFTRRVRADVARDDDSGAPLTDVSGVLGINANVHPPLLGHHLRYPCGTQEDWDGAGAGWSLEDCWVRCDADTGQLTLHAPGPDGPPLRLVMLNFLLDDLAPQLYRFLNFLGTGALSNLAWWDRVDQRRRTSGTRTYPRVRLGRAVLARRTWKVPAAELPVVDPAGGLATFRAVRDWRARLGLPEQVFCRAFTLPDPLVPTGEDGRRTWQRTLASFPTSAERKPAFVDFGSATGVLAWVRGLGRLGQDVTLQECLPEPGTAPRTREYLVETSGGAR